MKKAFLAVMIGSIIMLLVDLLSARITSSMLAIPFSVFVGAFIAGLIAEKKLWVIGLSVGLVNVMISLVLYMAIVDVKLLHESGYSASNVLAMPMTSSVMFGFVGGVVSGLVKANAPIFKNKTRNV